MASSITIEPAGTCFRSSIAALHDMTPTCRTTGIALAVLALGMGAGCSPEGHRDPRLGPEVERETAERSTRIQAEIAALGTGHPWAGSYYEGDGLGENVSVCLAPEAGFVFEWSGCLGLYDRNHGTVRERGGELELAFELPNVRGSLQGLGERFVPVAWGARHYLIEPGDFTSFANEVNARWEPRDEIYGDFLLRDGDEGVPVSGMPAVPARFAPLFLDAPLEAHVVAVVRSRMEWRHETDTRVTTVTLDVGAEDGAFVGMDLFAVDVPHGGSLTVTALEPTRSTAECLGDEGEDPVPAVGWTLRTRF